MARWPRGWTQMAHGSFPTSATTRFGKSRREPWVCGTVAVNSTSATQTLAFTFTGATSTTIQAPKIVTKGATGQDFIDAGTGTCTTTNGTGHPVRDRDQLHR